MGENSAIDWTDHTWNPWQGCKKVSPGCINCYMFRDKKRFGQDPNQIIKSNNSTFNKPIYWKESAKIFVCSWSDFFIEEADEWRNEAWDIIKKCPQHTFLILTKRPENIKDRLPVGWPFSNVWLGTTTENQEMANKRIPILLSIPAKIHFISVEPMIEEITLERKWLECISEGQYFNITECNHGLIDWVICGGESGNEARYMNPEWANKLKKQCRVTETSFFMKQMSGRTKEERKNIPQYLQIREFPY